MRRIDQWLANLGYCSRREARAWVDAGRIQIDGIQASDTGQKTAARSLLVDGQPLDHPAGILLLLNKPIGLVCSHESREGPSVYDLLPQRWRGRNPPITTIGRLDKDTSGVLLLTDQSALVHRLTSPKHKIAKRYVATVDRDLSAELGPLFASGTLLLTGEQHPCEPAQFRPLSSRDAELVLTEGRYHQVRRMFASQGYTVSALHRTHFGEYQVPDLTPGQWRELPL
jgi:16S rRNA pseudouridine516 synthase